MIYIYIYICFLSGALPPRIPLTTRTVYSSKLGDKGNVYSLYGLLLDGGQTKHDVLKAC